MSLIEETARPPDRARRVARRRAGCADRPHLRPLRRPAARAARALDLAALRADPPRRAHLRPRLRRRQGPALPARQGDRGAHEERRADLPVNVIILAEGEEEVGSAHLMPFVEAQRRTACAADAIVISDTRRCSRRGCRRSAPRCAGWPTSRSTSRARRTDLHSGSYGGAVVNPANAARAHHRQLPRRERPRRDRGLLRRRTCAAPEFLDRIRALPFDEEAFRAESGAPALGGEAGYTHAGAAVGPADLEVNGLLSGYTGEGAKTVLPAQAMAKVSCRLVPDQNPGADPGAVRGARAAGRAGGGEGNGPGAARRGAVEGAAGGPLYEAAGPGARDGVRPRAGLSQARAARSRSCRRSSAYSARRCSSWASACRARTRTRPTSR